MLSFIDRHLVSIPGWMRTQLSIAGRVLELPEVLNKKGISDHSPFQVTPPPGQPMPKNGRPVYPEICEHPACVRCL
eukprot:6741080-Pyramimonas_sp.AAC.1